MKKIARLGILSLVALSMAFAACDKAGEATSEHIIYYTVTDTRAPLPANSTARLATEAEWDVLLDRFCDYARGGSIVTFCGNGKDTGKTATGNQKSTKDTPTSISTTSREELKVWMKEMEQAGRTVIVSYDETSGIWNGSAYANLGTGNTQSEIRTYTGFLSLAPMPEIEGAPASGAVLALQVGADSTFILTFHGMMMWLDGVDGLSLVSDNEVSFEGRENSHTDLNGNPFLSLEINIKEDSEFVF